MKNKETYDAIGCDKCNGTGYCERIGLFEILIISDEIKEGDHIYTGVSGKKSKDGTQRRPPRMF